MADSASGSMDKSVQVKLVLLGEDGTTLEAGMVWAATTHYSHRTLFVIN